jgi:hypothetical protein
MAEAVEKLIRATVSDSNMAEAIENLIRALPPDDLITLVIGNLGILACAEQVSFPSRVYSRNIPEIRLLPPVYNWEFTRRHPYYLQYQPLGALYVGFAGDRTQALLRPDLWAKAEKAAALLRHLGWLGPYIHPSRDPRRLRFLRANHPPFSNPQARPVSYIALAAKLLLELPTATRKQVGRILAGDTWETEGEPAGANLAAGLASLLRIADPFMERPLPELLYISPEASEKGVQDAARSVVAHYRSQSEAPVMRRLAEAQLEEYLAVWDLREGWVNGHYDWKRTMRFRELAVALNTPEGTVKNRYRAAFRYITGHDYTPDLFAALFGPLACHQSKWAGWRRSKQRQADPGSPRTFTNTTGTSDEEGRDPGNLDQPPACTFDPKDLIDLKTDILELAHRGRTDAQIAAELELPAEHIPEIIAFFRGHDSEEL